MKRCRRALAAAAMLCWLLPAAAGTRFELVAMFGPDRLPGARVCFSRAYEGPRRTIVDYLVSGPETRCVPADRILKLPAGLWHYYVVADDPYLVSTHPTELQRPTDSSEGEEVSRIVADLFPAATVNVGAAAKTLGPADMLALYVTHAGSDVSAPALVPVSPGVTEMPVPAGTPVIPVIVRDRRIVAVGEKLLLDVGEAGDATFPVRTTATVVVPFRIPRGSGPLRQPPVIRAYHRRAERVIGEYKPEKADWRGLVFLHDVPRGRMDVLVDSREASARAISIDVPANGVVTTQDVMMEAPRAATVIQWSIDPAFAADLKQAAGCDAAKAPASDAKPRLRIHKCADDRMVTRPIELVGCTLLHEEVLSDAISGEIAVPLTEPGQAILELTLDDISAFDRVFVNEGKASAGTVRLAPASIRGRVTERDRPVAAAVQCGGPERPTDSSGHYHCWRPDGARRVVAVHPCDGSGVYRQEFDAGAETVDVHIPGNTLRVEVRDAATGNALPAAIVAYWQGPASAVPEPDNVKLGDTDEAGEVKAARLQPRRDASVCAFKKGFEKACRENVEIAAEGDAVVSLTLTPLSAVTASIIGAPEIVDGRVFVMFGPALLEDAAVERNGGFGLRAVPPAGAAFVLTSRTLPLCVLEPVTLTADDLRLRVPRVQPVSFVVKSTNARTAVTLELGGVLVSSNAMLRHQGLRHAQYVVDPEHPLHVTDVDGARGVAVVAGAVAAANATGDPRTLPRYPLGARREVTLSQ
jgi:hypothetical protein